MKTLERIAYALERLADHFAPKYGESVAVEIPKGRTHEPRYGPPPTQQKIESYFDELNTACGTTKTNESQFGNCVDYWVNAPDWAKSCVWNKNGEFYYYGTVCPRKLECQFVSTFMWESVHTFNRPPLTDEEWATMEPMRRPEAEPEEPVDYWADAPDWVRYYTWNKGGYFWWHGCKPKKYDECFGVLEPARECKQPLYDRPPLTDAEWAAMEPVRRPAAEPDIPYPWEWLECDWCTFNESGSFVNHKYEPIKNMQYRCWLCAGCKNDDCIEISMLSTPTKYGDWRQSLRRRPEGQ